MRSFKVISFILAFQFLQAQASEKSAILEKELESQMETFSQKILKCHPLKPVKKARERTDQLDLTINAQGRIAQVDLTSSVKTDAAVMNCLRKEFGSLTFSKPPGGENYPFQGNFTFNPPLESEWKNVSDSEEVTRTINFHSVEVSACYKKLLDDDKQPKFEGDLTVTWTLSGSGKAQNIGFPNNETKSESFKKCIKEKISTWQFPKPPSKDQSEISYTFFFKEK